MLFLKYASLKFSLPQVELHTMLNIFQNLFLNLKQPKGDQQSNQVILTRGKSTIYITLN